MKNQVRAWLNYDFLLAFMILEFMPTSGTCLRPLLSCAQAPRRTPLGKHRPLLLKLHRILLNTELQIATIHQLDFAENEKSICHSCLYCIVLLSQDEPNQKSQDILRASGKVFAEKNLQDQLMPCC